VWFIDNSDEDVRAEAESRRAGGMIPVDDGRCLQLQWVKIMHPSGRFGVLVGKEICNFGVGVLGDSCACSSSKAISHGVAQKVVRVKVQARDSVEAKVNPTFGAGAQRRMGEWQRRRTMAMR
jgi:hypothetical protein